MLRIFCSNLIQDGGIGWAWGDTPNLVGVVVDRPVGGKAAHPGNVVNGVLGPIRGIGIEPLGLLLGLLVGRQVV